MSNFEEKTVGEIVAEDYGTAAILQRHGIDFCCRGGKTIKEACQKQGVSETDLLAELKENSMSSVASANDFLSWKPSRLADYIVEKHHRYIERTTPALFQFLDKLCKVHGGNHPELFEIDDIFHRSAGALAAHTKKEELILFPAIKKLAEAKANAEKPESPMFGTIQNPIAMMMSEHETEGDNFEHIAKLSNSYEPPADGCATYKAAYFLLKEFEEDLHKHIHLESNILFPKAIELEHELSGVQR